MRVRLLEVSWARNRATVGMGLGLPFLTASVFPAPFLSQVPTVTSLPWNLTRLNGGICEGRAGIRGAGRESLGGISTSAPPNFLVSPPKQVLQHRMALDQVERGWLEYKGRSWEPAADFLGQAQRKGFLSPSPAHLFPRLWRGQKTPEAR